MIMRRILYEVFDYVVLYIICDVLVDDIDYIMGDNNICDIGKLCIW